MKKITTCAVAAVLLCGAMACATGCAYLSPIASSKAVLAKGSSLSAGVAASEENAETASSQYESADSTPAKTVSSKDANFTKSLSQNGISSASSTGAAASGQTASKTGTKAYYGKFEISAYVPTGAVEGFSKKSAEDYVGEEISVGADSLRTSNGSMNRPIFQEKQLSDRDFYDEWHATFSNAGFSGKSVTEIKVGNYSVKDGTDDRIGSVFILTEDNRLYTFIGGALFKLQKV